MRYDLNTRIVLALIAWLLRRLPDAGRRFELIERKLETQPELLPELPAAMPAAPAPLPELPSMAAGPVVLTVLAGPPAPSAARFHVIAHTATAALSAYVGSSGAAARDAYVAARESNAYQLVELYDGGLRRSGHPQ